MKQLLHLVISNWSISSQLEHWRTFQFLNSSPILPSNYPPFLPLSDIIVLPPLCLFRPNFSPTSPSCCSSCSFDRESTSSRTGFGIASKGLIVFVVFCRFAASGWGVGRLGLGLASVWRGGFYLSAQLLTVSFHMSFDEMVRATHPSPPLHLITNPPPPQHPLPRPSPHPHQQVPPCN